jgi:hypothetical protein
MPKVVQPVRHRGAIFAAVAGLVMLTVPPERAFAQRPSAPVKIENPASSPALTSSVDDPGRTAYQSYRQNNNCGGFICEIASFAQVPKGHRLVIQRISGLASSEVSSDLLFTLSEGFGLAGFARFFSPSSAGGFFNEPVLLYLDAEAFPVVTVRGTAVQTMDVTVTGYLLDCTISTCAPIVQ